MHLLDFENFIVVTEFLPGLVVTGSEDLSFHKCQNFFCLQNDQTFQPMQNDQTFLCLFVFFFFLMWQAK